MLPKKDNAEVLVEYNNGYTTINRKPVLGNINVDLTQSKKDYKQQQRDDFNNASEDGYEVVPVEEVCQDAVDGRPRTWAYYSEEDKSVNYVQYDLSNSEEARTILKEAMKTDVATAQEVYQRLEAKLQQLNNPESLIFKGIKAHEYQHKNNDKANLYAPGLSIAQYGMLNQYDEISANVADLLVINDEYKKMIASGISKEDALKVLRTETGDTFGFYLNALENGLNPQSKEAKKLMVQGTCEMWQEQHQSSYTRQIKSKMDYAAEKNDAASLAIGNDKEFKKRIAKMFDNIQNNEALKELNINPGNLSQYLPDEIIELNPALQMHADALSVRCSGLTMEEGKILSDIMPGSQKKDAKNLLKVMRGEKVSPKIGKIFHSLPAREYD